MKFNRDDGWLISNYTGNQIDRASERRAFFVNDQVHLVYFHYDWEVGWVTDQSVIFSREAALKFKHFIENNC